MRTPNRWERTAPVALQQEVPSRSTATAPRQGTQPKTSVPEAVTLSPVRTERSAIAAVVPVHAHITVALPEKQCSADPQRAEPTLDLSYEPPEIDGPIS